MDAGGNSVGKHYSKHVSAPFIQKKKKIMLNNTMAENRRGKLGKRMYFHKQAIRSVSPRTHKPTKALKGRACHLGVGVGGGPAK